MKAQASFEVLFSFIAMLLVASFFLASFPKPLEKTAEKLFEKQEKDKLSSSLSAYYLTGGQLKSEEKCVEKQEVSVFNEKVNPFLCSVKESRRWFLK